MTRSIKDVRPDGPAGPGGLYHVSFSRLVGVPIKDILVSLSNEWGDVGITLSQVVLKDGRTFFCEGEHDHPYLADYGHILDTDELEAMYREENPDEDEG